MKFKHLMNPYWFNTDPELEPGGGGGAPPEGDVPPPEGDVPPPEGDVPPPEGDVPPPEDWRNAIEDEGVKKLATRYNTVGDMAKALKEAQDKIRSGAIPKGLPEGASEEEIAAYRAELGIPETPDGYQLTLDEGLALGTEEEGIMQEVFAAAHGLNVSPDTMSKLTNAMLAGRAKEMERMETQDRLQAQQTTRILKDQWKGDFDTNRNMVSAFLNGLPAEIKELVENARLGDGSALFNKPEVLDYFASAQRQINPMAAIIPDAGSDSLKTVEAEIKTLEEKMGSPEWYKDKASQQRYQQLVDVRDSVNKKR